MQQKCEKPKDTRMCSILETNTLDLDSDQKIYKLHSANTVHQYNVAIQTFKLK